MFFYVKFALQNSKEGIKEIRVFFSRGNVNVIFCNYNKLMFRPSCSAILRYHSYVFATSDIQSGRAFELVIRRFYM